jgi:hypothetical protein
MGHISTYIHDYQDRSEQSISTSSTVKWLDMTRLLQIARNQLSALSGLGSAAATLDSLDVSENPLRDLENLPKMPALSELFACNCCQLSSLGALTIERCPNLACLDVQGSMLQCTEPVLLPLAGLTNMIDVRVGPNTTKAHSSAGRKGRAHSAKKCKDLMVSMADMQHLMPWLERFNRMECPQKRNTNDNKSLKPSGLTNTSPERKNPWANTESPHLPNEHRKACIDVSCESPLQNAKTTLDIAQLEDEDEGHTARQLKDFMNQIGIAGCPLQHLRALSARRKRGGATSDVKKVASDWVQQAFPAQQSIPRIGDPEVSKSSAVRIPSNVCKGMRRCLSCPKVANCAFSLQYYHMVIKCWSLRQK